MPGIDSGNLDAAGPILLPDEVLQWLPSDYDALTVDGQRQARVALCSSVSTIDDYIRAWTFFRHFYLLNSRPAPFYKDWVPSSAFHETMVRDYYSYRLNITGAPRGSGKSTVMAEEIPILNSLVIPNFSTAICTATLSLVGERFDHIMTQFTDNQLLIDDFGQLKPKRGLGRWSGEYLRLTNYSRLIGLAVEGRKRGVRPDSFHLDDPEYDSKKRVSEDKLRVEFEWMLFHVIFPMLRTKNRIFWIGTLSKRTFYIYHACHGDDPRFEHWNRRVFRAMRAQDDGSSALLWPEVWNEDSLRKMRAEIGPSAFSAEMLNDPISESDRVFRLNQDLDTYVIDGSFLPSPRGCSAPVRYTHVDPRTAAEEPRALPLHDLLASLYVLILVDVAHEVHPLADYSAVHVLGFDNMDTLWSLDLWAGRVRSDALIAQIYRLGEMWRPRTVGIEAVSIQKEIYERAKATLPITGVWVPTVLPVRYPANVSKPDRFAGQEWRFNTHRIKLPRDRSSNFAYRMLFQQIENFTMDMALLEYDDCFDTIAMVPYALRGRGKPRSLPDTPPLPYGVRPSGIPALSNMDASDLTLPQVADLLDKHYGLSYTPPGRTTPLSEVRIVR